MKSALIAMQDQIDHHNDIIREFYNKHECHFEHGAVYNFLQLDKANDIIAHFIKTFPEISKKDKFNIIDDIHLDILGMILLVANGNRPAAIIEIDMGYEKAFTLTKFICDICHMLAITYTNENEQVTFAKVLNIVFDTAYDKSHLPMEYVEHIIYNPLLQKTIPKFEKDCNGKMCDINLGTMLGYIEPLELTTIIDGDINVGTHLNIVRTGTGMAACFSFRLRDASLLSEHANWILRANTFLQVMDWKTLPKLQYMMSAKKLNVK